VQDMIMKTLNYQLEGFESYTLRYRESLKVFPQEINIIKTRGLFLIPYVERSREESLI